jgi:hypothetical protein
MAARVGRPFVVSGRPFRRPFLCAVVALAESRHPVVRLFVAGMGDAAARRIGHRAGSGSGG